MNSLHIHAFDSCSFPFEDRRSRDHRNGHAIVAAAVAELSTCVADGFKPNRCYSTEYIRLRAAFADCWGRKYFNVLNLLAYWQECRFWPNSGKETGIVRRGYSICTLSFFHFPRRSFGAVGDFGGVLCRLGTILWHIHGLTTRTVM